MRLRHAAGAATLVLLLTACGGSADGEEVEPTTGTTPAATEDAVDEAQDDGEEFLALGETAQIEPDFFHTFELTLNDLVVTDSVDLGELAGEEPQLDAFYVVDLTMRNTSDGSAPISDFLWGLRLRDSLESSGYSAGYADGPEEELAAELAPGEEFSGRFVGETYRGENYYWDFRGTSVSEVHWVVPAEQAEE